MAQEDKSSPDDVTLEWRPFGGKIHFSGRHPIARVAMWCVAVGAVLQLVAAVGGLWSVSNAAVALWQPDRSGWGGREVLFVGTNGLIEPDGRMLFAVCSATAAPRIANLAAQRLTVEGNADCWGFRATTIIPSQSILRSEGLLGARYHSGTISLVNGAALFQAARGLSGLLSVVILLLLSYAPILIANEDSSLFPRLRVGGEEAYPVGSAIAAAGLLLYLGWNPFLVWLACGVVGIGALGGATISGSVFYEFTRSRIGARLFALLIGWPVFAAIYVALTANGLVLFNYIMLAMLWPALPAGLFKLLVIGLGM